MTDERFVPVSRTRQPGLFSGDRRARLRETDPTFAANGSARGEPPRTRLENDTGAGIRLQMNAAAVVGTTKYYPVRAGRSGEGSATTFLLVLD